MKIFPTGIKPLTVMLATAMWLAGARDVAAQTLLMKLESSEFSGDSVLAGHQGEISLTSFSLGLANPATVNSGGGGILGGVPEFSDITVTKPVDKSSVALAAACAVGNVIDTGHIFVLVPSSGGGELNTLYEVGFSDAIVTSVSVNGATDDGVPTEYITLKFSRISWTYIPQSGDTTPITRGYDVVINVRDNTRL